MKLSIIIVSVITLVVVLGAVTLGSILTTQSVKRMKKTVSNKTIEMAVTAAQLIDGDLVDGVEESDKGTPKYDQAYDIMKAFRVSNEGTSGELAFIYGCRKVDEEHYIFLMDPSNDPANFGEELEKTEALASASNGVAAFDEEPYTDRWGTFYSAYAPVFSQTTGKVTMIVGIDVWADWYHKAVWDNSTSIIITTVVVSALGVALGLTVSFVLRKKMNDLLDDVVSLEEDVQRLSDALRYPGAEQNKAVFDKSAGGDTAVLRSLIKEAREEVQSYIAYAQKQAYIDVLCQIGNRTAYFQTVSTLENRDYSVIIIDINGLKLINDEFGHQNGDDAIIQVSKAATKAFGVENCFRIGGDEFVVILNAKDKAFIEKGLALIDKELKEVSKKTVYDVSVSYGYSSFDWTSDQKYSDVFVRADDAMYLQKEKYYEKIEKEQGSARKRRRFS